jgi:hypothetical protein
MNITALSKLEKGYVKLDWKQYIHRASLTSKDLERMLDTLDNFKSNRSTKELVLFKLKNSSFYVTIFKKEYSYLLKWLNSEFLDREMYEHCSKVKEIQLKIK